ncbi:P-loop containing nucleoside triphosphate hydrolase protein [Xylaria sp. CBS 124048]|nr:P-loop containing nucleoside triphosphate hydrolase protein [Xylaria sp. CBS 124048]
MSSREEKAESVIFTEEERRYFRALLAWEPSHVDLARKRSTPERPVAGRFRVLMLGSQGCGKTAILTRLCNGGFTGEGQPHNLDHERGCQRRIEIKGQSYIVDALELAPSQLSESQCLQHAVGMTEAAILTYDIRSRDSFDIIQDLYRRIEETLAVDKRQHYGFILIGNKADDDEAEDENMSPRMVTEAEGYELARTLGEGRTRCAFRETSARTGHNVDGLFVLLATELLKLRRLSQERRARAEELARRVAMGQVPAQGSDNKVVKWRIWARPWFSTRI